VAAAIQTARALDITIPHHVAGPAAGPATCTRDGQQWRIEYGYRSVQVPHSVGMLHLAVLLANPGQEIPCVDLAAGMANLHARGGTSAQPVLDRVAIREYRDRLARLDAEIDDPGPESGARRTERDWLIAELAAASGFNGRIRAFPNNPERARLAVSRAMRRSITVVTQRDARIGEHLHRSIHTGGRCSYRPT
jgi:hypothetical protein